MIKKLLALLFVAGMSCFAQQPEPELYQTWYLNFVQVSDLDTPFVVSQIEPQVNPTLTISEDLSFSGIGACNSFFGQFVYSDVFTSLQTSDFAATLLFCNDEQHNDLESSYFETLQTASQYIISPQGDGLQLVISTPIFGQAIFTNFQLSSSDFKYNTVAISPNPVTSQFSLQSGQAKISNVQIFNAFGQKVKTVENNFETIDISNLSSGVFIVKIDFESSTIYKRIIKN